MEIVCRHCGTPVHHVMADLGMQPLSNALREPEELNTMERFYPLKALVCQSCLLVQAPNYESAEDIFSATYPYFSSYSDTWLEHARAYTDAMIGRFGLGSTSQVVEIACNDGYLLRWFVPKGIPVLGIEPTASTAAAAEALGIPVQRKFFGRKVAIELREQGYAADLMPANNVVAHVPDINDFVGGFGELLKPAGVATFEFHHLLNLIQYRQFDTIYHEHFYYHSLSTFTRILAHNGLTVFDVEELPTHGGSLRVFAQRTDTAAHAVSDSVAALIERERAAGLTDLATYLAFNEQIRALKRRILTFLIQAKDEGKTICGVGAPAKGNTLLNYVGARTDFIEYTVDSNPHKQGHYLPGTTIPVKSPDCIFEDKPDYVLILPWNWADEIRQNMSAISAWVDVSSHWCRPSRSPRAAAMLREHAPRPPTRIGLVGTGPMARSFALLIARHHPDLIITRVLTRRPVAALADFPLPQALTHDVDDLAEHADIIVECSGDVAHATAVVERVFEAKLPVVTLNAELHVTTGSYLAGKGLITEAEGDQPGSIAALHEEAVQMGFRPLVYGNMKGFLNHDPSPEDMAYWARRQGISVANTTGATDGTKVQIEQAFVANGLAATITRTGLEGPASEDLQRAAAELAVKAESMGQAIADYVLAVKWAPTGVFVVARHDDDLAGTLETSSSDAGRTTCW